MRDKLLTILLLSATLFCHAGETTVLSYNVWFDDESGLSHRYRQINEFILQQNPDYACLQEVTPGYLQRLKRALAGKYQIYDEGVARKRYGNVILAREGEHHAETLPLESRMGRNALIVTGAKYTLVNLHLESMLDDTAIRERQLTQVIAHTREAKELLLCGDFNFGDGERENRLLSGFVDAGKQKAEPTFDSVNNELADETRFYDEGSRRLDKIVARTSDKDLEFQVIKRDYSDHYPVLLTLRSNAAAAR